MGQFKPMVKMMTTEPTVELKLKKGGSVAHKKMKSGGTCKMTGHKMMDGGMAPTVGTPMGGLAPSAAPAKPSMAARRAAMAKAMKGSRGMKPRATPPKGAKVVMPAMKKGGALEALKEHADKPASKAHKGLKTGGVVKGQGGYKTGGVVKGQGGYAEGGIIKSTTGKTKVVTATADNSPAKTGDVKLGNGGGYKKGGSTKKFAEGGSVQDDGRPQKMPQGNKKPSSAVAINQLSGTFKKGGAVGSKNLQAVFKKENAPAMKSAKADYDLKYSQYQKMKKFADGGQVSSFDESFASPAEQLAEMRKRKAMDKGYGQVSDRETASNEALLDSLTSLPASVKAMVRKALRGSGAVTDTETTVSRTVTPPAKKRGGKVSK